MSTIKSLYKTFLLIAVAAVFTGLIFSFIPGNFTNSNINEVLNYVLFQNISEPSIEIFIGVFLAVVPFLILIYPICGILSEDLQICSVYMFTRYNNKIKWYFKKIFNIFIASFTAVLLYFIITISSFLLRGVGNDFDYCKVLLLFLNVFAFVFLLSIFINIISLLMAKHFSYLCTVCVLIFGIILTTIKEINTNFLYYLNPINNFFYSWKENNQILNSTISLFISSLILIIVGAILIKSIDISTVDKESI